jgi:hypothetical protein
VTDLFAPDKQQGVNLPPDYALQCHTGDKRLTLDQAMPIFLALAQGKMKVYWLSKINGRISHHWVECGAWAKKGQYLMSFGVKGDRITQPWGVITPTGQRWCISKDGGNPATDKRLTIPLLQALTALLIERPLAEQSAEEELMKKKAKTKSKKKS